MVLAINTMFTRSATERENRLMFETAEKSSLQKTRMFSMLVMTPKMIKGYVVIWIGLSQVLNKSMLRICVGPAFLVRELFIKSKAFFIFFDKNSCKINTKNNSLLLGNTVKSEAFIAIVLMHDFSWNIGQATIVLTNVSAVIG